MQFLVPLDDGSITHAFEGPSHWGVDYGWVNTIYCNIYATADGVIVDNFFEATTGYTVVIRHTMENGKFRYSSYLHLNARSPKAIGTSVKQGEVIGVRGNTGQSSGPHLHFGLTSETSLAYNWERVVKGLAIDPHPLMHKYRNRTYTGVMFRTMPYLDEEPEPGPIPPGPPAKRRKGKFPWVLYNN